MDRMKVPAEPTAMEGVAKVVPIRIAPGASLLQQATVPVENVPPAGFQGQTDRTTLRAFMDSIRPQSAGRS